MENIRRDCGDGGRSRITWRDGAWPIPVQSADRAVERPDRPVLAGRGVFSDQLLAMGSPQSDSG